jgi:hypothetical protein
MWLWRSSAGEAGPPARGACRGAVVLRRSPRSRRTESSAATESSVFQNSVRRVYGAKQVRQRRDDPTQRNDRLSPPRAVSNTRNASDRRFRVRFRIRTDDFRLRAPRPSDCDRKLAARRQLQPSDPPADQRPRFAPRGRSSPLGSSCGGGAELRTTRVVRMVEQSPGRAAVAHPSAGRAPAGGLDGWCSPGSWPARW